MALTSKRRDKLMAEMEQFSTALNLLDDQKQKLQDFLSNVHETLHQERRNHGLSKEDLIETIAENRDLIGQRFLTPEQLTKWDSEVAKAKHFLSHKMADWFSNCAC